MMREKIIGNVLKSNYRLLAREEVGYVIGSRLEKRRLYYISVRTFLSLSGAKDAFAREQNLLRKRIANVRRSPKSRSPKLILNLEQELADLCIVKQVIKTSREETVVLPKIDKRKPKHQTIV